MLFQDCRIDFLFTSIDHQSTRNPRQTPLRHENAPLRIPQKIAHVFGVLFLLVPTTCRANRFGPIILGCGRAKKVPLGCMQRCTNMNNEKSQQTKCEDNELSKRSQKQALQL
jgi:hypothetical protein